MPRHASRHSVFASSMCARTLRKDSVLGLSLTIILTSLLLFSQLLSSGGFASAQSSSSGCVTYDSSTRSLTVKCDSLTLTEIANSLESSNSNILMLESEKVWRLNADLVIENGASLTITPQDTTWLKLMTPYGIIAYGNVVIDSVKITSWDSATNSYATTDGERPRSFITIWEGGTGQMNITNSELAYLGYHKSHKQGLAYYSGDGSILLNNDVHHMWYGFYSNNVGFLTIENSHFHDNVIYGLDPHTGTHDMVIRNNVVNNITKGIGIICSFECYDILIENNVVYDVSSVGIMLSRNTTNSIIRNNVVYNSGENGGGISIDDSSYNLAYNNTLSQGRFGIKVSKNSDNNLVHSNSIADYSSYGICMMDGSSNNKVRDNTIKNSGEYGICVMRQASGNEVSYNAISGSGYYGVYVKDGNAVDNVFKSNKITETGQDGVRIFNNTESTFISNKVTGSTKNDYSVISSKLSLYNTTFSSTYFGGTSANDEDQVNIVNSDNRLIISEQKFDNIVREDQVSMNFRLDDGETAILSTIPFSVKPLGKATTVISLLEETLSAGFVQTSWTERSTGLGPTTVIHRVDGLDSGTPTRVVVDKNETIAEKVIGEDGTLEFTTDASIGNKEYTIYSEIDVGDQSGSENTTGSVNYSNSKTYGCKEYEGRIRCDLLVNDLTSQSVDGQFTVVKPLSTASAAFVEGKYGEAIEINASFRESVEIINNPEINSKEFSLSFWLRNSDVAEPYGQIVSHINFAGNAGWLIDLTSNTANRPFDQRIQLGVANSNGDLFTTKEVPLPQDRFVHVAGTFDGSTIKLYLDGVLAQESAFNGEFNPDPGTPLRIGSASYSTSTHRWSGIIDDFMLFDRALSQEEIGQVSKSNVDENFDTSLISDLVGHWPFENDVSDVTGHGNDGSMTTLLASMAFAPDGRLFFAEKNTGNIMIMKNDVILEEPFVHIPDVFVSWEQGLLGLTLDSDFEKNHYLYQYYTYIDGSTGAVSNKVIRFTDVDDKGTDMKVLIDKIPAVKGYHSGGALAFGPDGMLYITVGDATEHPFAQDPNILVGKVLRITRDGGIPSDNPNPNSPVYTKGHRNSYGIAFDPSSGIGIITENGDAAYDEINVIASGGNYGFPTFQPANMPPELADGSKSILPARSYYETIAPTQAIYYTGNKIPELKDKFLFGTFTGDIYALTIDRESKKIIGEERIELHPTLFTPVIGIAQAPNGDLYYGSYSIFKLESLDQPTRTQDVLSIRIAASDEVLLKDMVFDQDQKRIVLDLSTGRTAISSISSNSSSGAQSNMLSLTIPRAMMDEIITVTDEANNALEFKVESGGGTSSTGGYNEIVISLGQKQAQDQDTRVAIVAARVVPEFPLSQALVILVSFGLVVMLTIILSKKKGLATGDPAVGSGKLPFLALVMILMGILASTTTNDAANAQLPQIPLPPPFSSTDDANNSNLFAAPNDHDRPEIEILSKELKEGKNVLEVKVSDASDLKSRHVQYVSEGRVKITDLVRDHDNVYLALVEAQRPSSIIVVDIIDAAGNRAVVTEEFNVTESMSILDQFFSFLGSIFSFLSPQSG